MRLPPADVILSWPPPNYDDPITRGNALVIVNSIFIVFVVITVGLRLYTRLVIKRWFGIDDVFILLALLFTIGLTAIVLLANQRYGWDRHVWDIRFDQFVPASKIAMTSKVVFTAAASFTRLSLHCFYYRVIRDTGKTWFKWLIHANVVYTLGILVSFTFLAIFQCTPVRAYWTLGAPDGACMDEGVATLICGIINCVADFATTVTPMPLVMGLKMPLQQRLAVAVLFGLGIVVTIAGVVRTWFIYRSLFGEYDQTWYAYPLWIAAAIETDLGVICASAPVLKPLLAKIPFSLSDTFSCGISIKLSSGSSPSSKATVQAPPQSLSKLTSTSTPMSSKRRSEAIQAVPELEADQGKSYELKQWDDMERANTANFMSRGSEEVMLESQEEAKSRSGMRSLWGKLTSGKEKKEEMQDMTITRTSEVELQISPASGYNSKRSSRHPPPRVPPKLPPKDLPARSPLPTPRPS
ncbi:hypothetical protein FB567DRAFT_131994 [Paraphoma chrysanthemicola]|uniref:Rhodopsin domain-containing protein n=1 Tax=Paraphoma chrysanthemicola TaxID=798071 RepID=A0A8K0VUD6_9PLEO|nr:hypothetical protein FB567DRAFT_131994 [Paraphoma chrysanthemicola]